MGLAGQTNAWACQLAGNEDNESLVAGIKKEPLGLRRSASMAVPAKLLLARKDDATPEFQAGISISQSPSSDEESSGEEFEENQ